MAGRTSQRTLTVERPDTAATVDFLDHGVVVDMDVCNGVLYIKAKVQADPDASDWREDELEVKLDT